MKKLTLKDRVLAFLKGGDDAKVTRFVSKEEKYVAKQTQKCKDEIERLRDKITDAKEAMKDAVVGLNLDAINNTDSVEDYCVTYFNLIDQRLKVIDDLEDKIDTEEQKIARIEKVSAVIFEVETVAEAK